MTPSFQRTPGEGHRVNLHGPDITKFRWNRKRFLSIISDVCQCAGVSKTPDTTYIFLQ